MKQHKQERELSPELEQYLAVLKQMYLRMEAENSWPWVVDPEGWEKMIASQDEEGDPPKTD